MLVALTVACRVWPGVEGAPLPRSGGQGPVHAKVLALGRKKGLLPLSGRWRPCAAAMGEGLSRMARQRPWGWELRCLWAEHVARVLTGVHDHASRH